MYLIDHAFGEIRPTPWRQAIDLANMMLSLSVHFPAEIIYERASEHFSQAELAEAFAATRGVTIPGELKAALRTNNNASLDTFRELAPPREPISIQRWTRRRVLVLGALALAGFGLVALVIVNVTVAGRLF